MNVVIVVAGVVGLAVAAYVFVDLADRRRAPPPVLDIALVVAAVVGHDRWLLLVYGDRAPAVAAAAAAPALPIRSAA